MKNKKYTEEQLNEILKPYLRDRSILVDEWKNKTSINLTDDELFLIQKSIESKDWEKSKVRHISKRHHLDYIGWHNEKYRDVLICKNKGA